MLGHKIRAIRINKGISSAKIAENLGITVQGLSKIERNEVDLSYENLKCISESLGVEIKDIEQYADTYTFNVHNNSDSQGLGVVNFYNQESKSVLEILNMILETQKEIIALLKK